MYKEYPTRNTIPVRNDYDRSINFSLPYLVVVKMADGGEEGELRVDKLEEDPGANGENDPVPVPVSRVLHHE
jgi:hypothetical protein